MRFQIEITEQADADLRGIFEYIAIELRSVQNAAGQLDRLEEAIFSLESMPERYRAYTRGPWHERGLRVMPVDNYLVFYIPDTAAQVVIMSFYHLNINKSTVCAPRLRTAAPPYIHILGGQPVTAKTAEDPRPPL